MKSRRRIAFLKAWDHANCIDDYSRDLPLAKWGSGVSLQSSNLKPPTSALGQKQTLEQVRVMSALPPKADIGTRPCDVRFVPKADILRCGKKRRYSITLSASERTDSGMVNPSAFAVLRLIDSSYLVGCWIGSCPGLAPLRTRSMYSAAWRNNSAKSVP